MKSKTRCVTSCSSSAPVEYAKLISESVLPPTSGYVNLANSFISVMGTWYLTARLTAAIKADVFSSEFMTTAFLASISHKME